MTTDDAIVTGAGRTGPFLARAAQEVEMESREIRAALDAHWAASNANDFAAEHEIYREDAVLCVHNLSRFPQPIELNLPNWAGYTPVELTGRVPFPRIGVQPYLLTLPGHSFYWLQLCEPEPEPAHARREEAD